MKKTARDFAVERHGNQQYGAHPYYVHLDAVAAIAEPYGEQAMITAYLHDVVEDTNTTLEEIETLFGSLVARCVAILSDEAGPNRKARKIKTYEKMQRVSGEESLALIVKTADRLANVKACINDQHQRLLDTYRQEHPAFTLAVYREGLCDELWEELNRLLQ